MRVLRQTGFPQDTDLAKFPDGQIQNQTEAVPGTPVVREVYGDVLTNLYNLLKITGETATGTEDSDTSQYQIISALKKFANELNDVQKVLTLDGTVWRVNFDIDLLPDKYVFWAKTSDAYDPGETYTFEGTGSNSYSLTSDTGFGVSTDVFVVIDQSGVKVIDFGAITNATETVANPFGNPLTFNDSPTMHYLNDGKILKDEPSINDVQTVIQVFASNVNLLVTDAILFKGKLLVLVYDTALQTYQFYSFPVGDLTTPTLVTLTGFSFPVAVDRQPYLYCDGTLLYLTNNSGNSVNDYDFNSLSFDEIGNEITLSSSFSIDPSFDKTTNAFISGSDLYTFVNNDLEKYTLPGGVRTQLGNYNNANGIVFKFNGATYYTSGEVGLKWSI